MTLTLWILAFIASLAVLIKSSDYFTEAAERLGVCLNIPKFIVGVTIVAIGTSLPELTSSIVAVLKGASEIVVANVLGSNITNIFLVLGVAAIASKKIKLTHELMNVDLPLFVGTAFLLAASIWDGFFTTSEAILCIITFIVYILYAASVEKKEKEVKKELKGELKREKISLNMILTLIISAAFIYIGAKYTVDSLVQISILTNIGTEIIAVSAVALGTSLPELVVTITAARKGKPEIAVGNVLGSNIFNAMAVMGIPALIGTLTIPDNMITFALPMMLIATFLYYFITIDKEITKWEGALLVIFYVFFIIKSFSI